MSSNIFAKAALPAAIAACIYVPQASANAINLYNCAAHSSADTICEIKDANGKVVLKAKQSDIEIEGTHSFVIKNQAFIPLPSPSLANPLASADTRLSSVDIRVTFQHNQLNTINGKAAVPLAELQAILPLGNLGKIPGAPGNLINSQETVMTNLGYDLGRHIGALGGHTQDDVKYLFMSTQSAFGEEVESGDISLGAGVDGGVTVVFNANDPYVYAGFTPVSPGVGIEISDDESEDNSQDWGMGYSYQGQIPFAAQSPLALGQSYTEFNGNVVIDGIIPIPPILLELDGSLVTQTPGTQINKIVEAISSGQLETLPPDTKLGGNGGISLGLSIFGPLQATLDLGDASLGITTSTTAGDAPLTIFLSGNMEAGQWELFEGMPFSPGQQTLQVSGMFGLETSRGYVQVNDQSHLRIAGSYALDFQAIQTLTGINIGDLSNINGSMQIDANGFRLTGTSAHGPTLPFVNFTNAVEVDVYVPFHNAADFELTLRGNMNVTAGGIGIINKGEVRLSSQGAFLAIDYNTPISKIAVAGEITNSGFLLQGHTALIIPLSVLNDASLIELRKAQNEVNRVNNEIQKQRNIVQAERNRDAQNISRAQQDIDKEIAKINSLNTQIQHQHNVINHHRHMIEQKRRWASSCSWWQSLGCWASFSAEAAWRSGAIAWAYTQIGSLHTARGVAQGALWFARQTLEGVRQAAIHTPIDMDPRVSALFVARDTATLALTAAQETIKALPELADVRGDITINLSHRGAGGHIAAGYCPNGACQDVLGGRLLFNPAPKACVTLPAIGEHCVGI